MAKTTKEITICDICENDTKGFYYWESTNSSFGVIDERTLIIDTCEHCARETRWDIPKSMMKERYGSEIASEEEIQESISKWKSKVLEDSY